MMMQTVNRIGDRFWYMTPVAETDRPILGMVVGDKKVLMIDAGNSESHAQYFLEELSKQGVPSPDYVALTHAHWDHIFGLSFLKNVISFSSVQTKAEIQKLLPLSWSNEDLDARVMEGTEIEFCATAIKKEFSSHREISITLPTITYEKKIEIELGGVTCILQHVGGDHAQDSIVVFVKEERILFLNDCIYPDIFSKKRNYTVERTLNLVEELELFDADTYILSHWKPITKDEFNVEMQLLKTLAELTRMFNGDQNSIKEAYVKQVERELNQDEIETLDYFVNGYKM